MDLALNITIAVLLVIVIIFCFILSRRISVFNTNKLELRRFLEDFNSSIMRAETNIDELKKMGNLVDENLKSQIKKARFLANDLSFLTDKGENIADNLEKKISTSKNIRQAGQPKPTNQFRDNGVNNLRHPSPSQPQPQTSNNQSSISKKQLLDNLLKEISKRKNEIK